MQLKYGIFLKIAKIIPIIIIIYIHKLGIIRRLCLIIHTIKYIIAKHNNIKAYALYEKALLKSNLNIDTHILVTPQPGQ